MQSRFDTCTQLNESGHLGRLAAAMMIAAIPLLQAVHNRRDNPVPPSDATMASYDDWVDVCQWVSTTLRPTPSSSRRG